jgi:hypothetical protein
MKLPLYVEPISISGVLLSFPASYLAASQPPRDHRKSTAPAHVVILEKYLLVVLTLPQIASLILAYSTPQPL